MNIYEENETTGATIDLDVATSELKATSLIQNDGVRRSRMAEISAAALLDIARSLRMLALEAEGAMLPAATVEYIAGEGVEYIAGDDSDGPRDFLLEGDLVHKIDDDEPGVVVALGFDGDGALYADVEFGAGLVRLYVSSLVRLVGDEARDLEALEAIEALIEEGDDPVGTISDEEEAADPDLVDLDAGTIALADLVDDIEADFGDESHPAAESAVDVLRANEAARKAAKKKGGKK